MVAAEVADLPLDPAPLEGAVDAGTAVEALDAEVRPEGDPPVGLHPCPAQPQHLGDGGLEVVVAHPAPRDTVQHPQRVHVPLEEGFLAGGGEHPVDGLARIRQAEGEQVAGHQLTGESHGHVAKVDLRLHAGRMGLRDERLNGRLARLHRDLRLPVGDIAPDHRIRHVRAVLLDQPVEDPRDRVPLLARRVQVRPQDPVDHRLVRIKRRRPRRQRLARLRPGRVQGLAHRPPGHVVLALQLPHGHAGPVVPTDRRVQLDLRHDQDLSPGTPRCCPDKPPTAFKTREHHPTVETGASQTRVQPPSRLVNKATLTQLCDDHRE